jgi:hypothetical protein
MVGANIHRDINVTAVSSKQAFSLKKKLRGLVRQRTIPTERPPLVGEVNANVV